MAQLLGNLRCGGDAAIDHQRQMREVFFEAMHHLIPQRRHFAIGFGRETFEPGVAGMHDEGMAAGLAYGANKIAHHVIALDFVNADPVLDRDGDADRIDHGLHAVGHQRGLGHQARPKRAALHPLARAAAVQVDLVVAPGFACLSALRQIMRLAAAELQRHRVLLSIELQMPRHIAMNQRARGDHLGIEQRVLGQQTVKVAAMAIRPVHHGGDRQPVRTVRQYPVFGDCLALCHAVSRKVSRICMTSSQPLKNASTQRGSKCRPVCERINSLALSSSHTFL